MRRRAETESGKLIQNRASKIQHVIGVLLPALMIWNAGQPGCFAETNGVVVPFELHRGHVMVPARVTNSAPLSLLLDTGYAMTMLHPDHTAAFGLKRAGRGVTIVGIAGKANADTFEGPTFQFGEVTWQPRHVGALPGASGNRGRRRDGILGSGFFRRFVVEVDSQGKQLRLHEPDTFVYRGTGEALPIRFSGDTPVVEAVVRLPNQSEVPARFEVDTGCDGAICVGRHFVQAHGLAPAPGPSTSDAARSGEGGATRTREARLPQLRLGRIVIERPEASLFLEGSPVDPPMAGHLGWDLLRRFKVIFDYKRNRMILEDDPRLTTKGQGP